MQAPTQRYCCCSHRAAKAPRRRSAAGPKAEDREVHGGADRRAVRGLGGQLQVFCRAQCAPSAAARRAPAASRAARCRCSAVGPQPAGHLAPAAGLVCRRNRAPVARCAQGARSPCPAAVGACASGAQDTCCVPSCRSAACARQPRTGRGNLTRCPRRNRAGRRRLCAGKDSAASGVVRGAGACVCATAPRRARLAARCRAVER